MEIILSIAGVLLGGTSVYTIIENIKYRKENKDLKKNEVEQSDIATQTQKIELGNKYMQDSLSMMELVKQSLDRGEGNQERILVKIDKVEDKVDDIVTYLNGDFQEFLKRTHKKGVEDGM